MAMSPEERRRRMHKARGRRMPVTNETGMQAEDYLGSIDISKSGSASVSEASVAPGERYFVTGTESRTEAGTESGKEPATGSSTEPAADPSGEPYYAESETREGFRRSRSAKAKKKNDSISRLIIIAAVLFIAAVVAVSGIRSILGATGSGKAGKAVGNETAVSVSSGDNLYGENGTGQEGSEQSDAAQSETAAMNKDEEILAEARLMAAQYDYDGAVSLAKTVGDYEGNTEAQQLVALCEETKTTLVEQNINEITHIFFHILCVEPENSFDEGKWGKQAGGYNSLMTTVDEFNKMMQELYDKGYVLVSIRDLAQEMVNADGTVTMKKGSIMLPPGKKAFVMSEDDVCYYEYMKGAGYADKIIVGDDGKPLVHYVDGDGVEHTGAYDIVGCLDEFIEKHPDFSYKGHKACLVFTGYNGILGYRTDESYDPTSEYYDPSLEQGHDVEEERRQAVEVLKALDADGYDLGSHSWGHRDLGQIEMDRFKKDCDRWNRNVAPLIKEATGRQPDIIIYPKGADVADWRGYDHSNQRFDYLWNLGFRYFCNVDSSQYWVQLGDDYLRQGRRALDGYNMWNDIANGYNRLGDLFDNVSEIFDPARPTPVPSY